MSVFTRSAFRNVLKNVDYDNDSSFETFSESLMDSYDVLTDIDHEEIIDFLNSELDVISDSEVHQMENTDIGLLCDYINSLVEE